MSTETWSIHKSYEDERERGVGTNLSKAAPVKGLKAWGKGVLPTRQQKQAAGIAALTGAGGYAGTRYKQSKTYGDPTIPPAMRRASRVVKIDDVSKAKPPKYVGGSSFPKKANKDALKALYPKRPQYVKGSPTPSWKTLSARNKAVGEYKDFGKAQRQVDPEYDRARRRGVLQGAAVGASIPLSLAGSKMFQRTGTADMAGKPQSWRGKTIAIRSTPTGRFPRGRAGALAGSAALLGGAAMSQRRGTRERNRQWT